MLSEVTCQEKNNGHGVSYFLFDFLSQMTNVVIPVIMLNRAMSFLKKSHSKMAEIAEVDLQPHTRFFRAHYFMMAAMLAGAVCSFVITIYGLTQRKLPAASGDFGEYFGALIKVFYLLGMICWYLQNSCLVYVLYRFIKEDRRNVDWMV